MDILVMAGQLILGLTILVGVHELGHMLTAKWFGMRVEKFSIGFPPKIFGKQIGETEYMLGAIPLGGFVKITGMVDESLDTEALKEEPKPYEFRAKPAWQRLIVMLGGIIVNVLTGILIFTFITYLYGESYLPASEVRYGIVPNKLGQEIGFRTGDKIVKINGRPFTEFNDVYSPEVVLGSGSYYTVERGNQLIDVPVPNNFMDRLSDQDQSLFVAPLDPFVVAEVVPGQPASKAGLKAGDRIAQVAGKPIQFFPELQQALKDNAGKETPLLVERGGQTVALKVNVDEDGKVGFRPKSLLQYATRKYSLVESVPAGTKQAFGIITTQIKAFGKIFRGEASARKSLGGPMAIAQQYGATFDWLKFWTLTGMLSMVLAFMNLLPIPALDGGHVMFLTYEMISGRKPSDKFLENAQKVGMAMILSLMVFVIFNDLIKSLF
ncbi:RIP metalloprotease RseP [Hymenobacter lutimineralis]|uniref:Zinc metalloprotease n=1 Tax=Hymenobacter lutimineralis TaxID=2606448 RepID=A0A5D6V0M6_9BACT|nr:MULTISPECIES: RIP metalloprotease RseP [Hymenobacter]QIX60733.1 RIP metalloprotease RseP [Hymenobacter sp. BT18]TYZ08628.1 RIP metalloprotease RseP [Hymenobacter lutimineralis]